MNYILWMKKFPISFSLESEKCILYVTKAYLLHDLYFVYVVKAYITLKYMSLLSNISLVCIYLLSS